VKLKSLYPIPHTLYRTWRTLLNKEIYQITCNLETILPQITSTGNMSCAKDFHLLAHEIQKIESWLVPIMTHLDIKISSNFYLLLHIVLQNQFMLNTRRKSNTLLAILENYSVSTREVEIWSRLQFASSCSMKDGILVCSCINTL